MKLSKYVRRAAKSVYLVDSVCVIGLLLYALALALGRWSGRTTISDLSTDAADICSFAVATLNPSAFRDDALLGNPDSYRFYWTIHAPVLAFLTSVFGNCGVANVFLLFWHVLLQALGFYYLGRYFYQSRLYGLSLSLFTLHYIELNLGEFWGAYPDMLPRFSFQAILPLLLLMALKFHKQAFGRLIVMAVCGIAMFVHPVSAPPWALGLLLGFLIVERGDGCRSTLLNILGLGGTFLLFSSPFLLHYLASHQHGPTESYQELSEILRERIAPEFFDVRIAVRNFITIPEVVVLLLWGAWGLVLMFRKRMLLRGQEQLALGWVLGLAIACVVLPALQQFAESQFESLPIELDLVRGLRYLLPLSYLFGLWGVKCVIESSFAVHGFRYLQRVCILVCAAVLASNPWVERAMSAWGRGLAIPSASPQEVYLENFYAEISATTRQGATILTTPGLDPLAVRYTSLRSLTFARKDGGMFAYGNHVLLQQWKHQLDQLKEAVLNDDPLCAIKRLAETWKSNYILIQDDDDLTTRTACAMPVRAELRGDSFGAVRGRTVLLEVEVPNTAIDDSFRR